MLTKEQQKYFDEIVDKIKVKLNIDIPIIAYDHNLFKNKRTQGILMSNCSGLAWCKADKKVYKISIDEAFILKSWNEKILSEKEMSKKSKIGIFVPDVPYYKKQLQNTICHEIAHIFQYRHGKKHEKLTHDFYLSVKTC